VAAALVGIPPQFARDKFIQLTVDTLSHFGQQIVGQVVVNLVKQRRQAEVDIPQR